MEYPHDKSVKDILFQPMNNDESLRCVTLSDDKKFKIWQLVESNTVESKIFCLVINIVSSNVNNFLFDFFNFFFRVLQSCLFLEKGIVWKCFGVGFFRDLSCSGLSFSVDGSLMAIGFGQIVTTWTPDSCEMKCSLFHPNHKEKIKYLKFGYSNQCHLLASASVNQLSVWNVLTLCMIWTVPIRVDFLIADPLSTHMAVLTADKKGIMFV